MAEGNTDLSLGLVCPLGIQIESVSRYWRLTPRNGTGAEVGRVLRGSQEGGKSGLLDGSGEFSGNGGGAGGQAPARGLLQGQGGDGPDTRCLLTQLDLMRTDMEGTVHSLS